jgi:ribonuclease HI
MELDHFAAGHKVEWTWTKDYANYEDNNRWDELATRGTGPSLID